MSDPAPQTRAEALQALFEEVSELPAHERAAFLDAQCAGDGALRADVESLLDADTRAGPFLAEPTIESHRIGPTPAAPQEHPEQIGPYKLLRAIGEGGFGTVYLAAQQYPVRRRVAVKVIKWGMDTRQVIARFEAERQALAMMDHPNIAKVFDAGATDAGRPFFVMELVDGVPITKYCDEQRLTARQRLELFVAVCHAVQHAHQKGIIHRDVKPTNVLVTLHDGRPVPKVIDFGVAKATQARLTEQTVFTEQRTMIGTPQYMSPEQAEMGGADVDTRTDVYSLGVLMYELLTGVTPFDPRELRGRALAEVQRVIREVDPPRPSTRLSTIETIASVAAQRGVEPRKLSALVRGELDWIVMKALEKDRQRRYESASGLASDIRRYLEGDAVLAAPPGRAYRFKKFVRRNRGPVTAVAAVMTVLVAGVVGTTLGMLGEARQRIEAQKQEQEARQQAAIATAVSDFQTDMFDTADPERLMGDKVTVLQAITAAVDELDKGKLQSQPAVEAAVRSSIGNTLRALGRYDRAEPNLRRALELRRSALPAGHRDTTRSVKRLALLLREQGKAAESELLFREALALHRRGMPADDAEIASDLNNVAAASFGQGKLADAEAGFREALEINRKSVPANEEDIATSLNNLAVALRAQGKLEEAERLLRESLDLRRKSLPANHPNTAATLQSLAQVLQASGRLAEAEPIYREALAIRREVLPARHPDIAMALNNLAFLLHARGEFAASEPLCREALAICRESLAPGHPNIASTLAGLAAELQAQGRLDEAEPLIREALAIRRGAMPAGHPDVAGSLQGLGSLLHEQGKFAEGEAALLEADAILVAAHGIPPAAHYRCVEALVALYAEWNSSAPNQGYDVTAERWRAKLPTSRPTNPGRTTDPAARGDASPKG